MASGQGILERLKKAKAQVTIDLRAGILPMSAYYGRDPKSEEMRNKMYAAIERAMAFKEPDQDFKGRYHRYALVDLKDAIAIVNSASSPIEFLVSKGELETTADEDGMSGVRFHAAIRLRDLLEGSQVNGIKSPSFSGGGGGGGGKPVDIRGYQLDCMKLMANVKRKMPEPWLFKLLESVVFQDDWLDLLPVEDQNEKRAEAKRKNRQKTIQALHYALDMASLTLGYIGEDDFSQRWSKVPAVPPSTRRHTRGSTASNQLALLTLQASRKQ